MSVGWGIFVMVLSWLGLRRGHRWTVPTLWAGGLPALALAALSEPVRYRTVEVGSAMSMVVLGIFAVGLLLAGRALRPLEG